MTRNLKTKKQQFWPGSNILKSSNNAFDWQATATGLYTKDELSHIQAYVKSKMNLNVKPTIQTFTIAKPSRFTNGG